MTYFGGLTDKQQKTADEETARQNVFIDKFKGNDKITQEKILAAMTDSKEYEGTDSKEIEKAAKQVYDKLQIVNAEVLAWYEILLACITMVIGYMSPIWLMMFQVALRQMEMEDEVMQFQTIILMLMRIERVNVEIILDWLERYSNIFREPIARCVNNYEAGAWEALEVLKNETNYQLFIRIVESLQAAVERIPIRDAFDELDSERTYYQDKRKQTNERLISRKSLYGKIIGFAPMVCMFVGYLIVPLVYVGLTAMSSSMSSIS